jgi:hypothetical protein
MTASRTDEDLGRDRGGIRAAAGRLADTRSDPDDDSPVRGISIIPIPRRAIARLHGTLRLNELPRHKSTIDVDTNRQFADIQNE